MAKVNQGKNLKTSPRKVLTTPNQFNNSRNAKLVLFFFGLGPIILMVIFLFSKGFFG